MTGKQIQKVARRQFQTAWLWLENSFVYDWESDVFLIMRTSQYAIEIEVKISRSDFFADMKKPKHQLFQLKQEKVTKPDGYGHRYVDGKPVYWTDIKWVERSSLIPNQFYFAVPEGLVKLEEVPAYAGLIEIRKGWPKIVKKAPYLHKQKRMDVLAPVLMEKFWYKMNTLEMKLTEMKGGQLWLS